MKEEKNDNYYLNRMIFYIDCIFNYYELIKNKNKTIMANDQESDGIVYKFLQLKEETNKLSNEFLINNIEISKNIRLLNGFRNRIVHDYDNILYSFFIEIIENDLPKLKEMIQKLL